MPFFLALSQICLVSGKEKGQKKNESIPLSGDIASLAEVGLQALSYLENDQQPLQ